MNANPESRLTKTKDGTEEAFDFGDFVSQAEDELYSEEPKKEEPKDEELTDVESKENEEAAKGGEPEPGKEEEKVGEEEPKEEEAKADEGKVEEKKEEEAEPSETEVLKAQVVTLMEALKSERSKQPKVEEVKKEEPKAEEKKEPDKKGFSFNISDEKFESIVASKESFEGFMTEFGQSIISAMPKSEAQVQQQSGDIDSLVATQVELHNLRRDFFTDNPDLVPFASYVGQVADNLQESGKQYNSYSELFTDVEKEVRKNLKLKKQVKIKEEAERKPGFVKQQSGSRKTGEEKKLSEMDKDIADLIGDL